VTAKTKAKIQKLIKSLPIYCLILVGLTAFSYFIVYQPYAVRQDKKRFEKAEASLDELYAKIVATVGKPDQEKKDKSCVYSSPFNEFQTKGDLSCAVDLYFLFSPKSLASSNYVMAAMSKIIGTSPHNSQGEHDYLGRPNPKNFVGYNGRGLSQKFSQNLNIQFDNVSCGISYIYPVVALFDKEFSNLATENLEIILDCSGSARAEHYPVSN
jgi:hypothetical protein